MVVVNVPSLLTNTQTSSDFIESQRIPERIRQRSPSPLPSSVSSFWIARSQEEIAPEAYQHGWTPPLRNYGHSMNRGIVTKKLHFKYSDVL